MSSAHQVFETVELFEALLCQFPTKDILRWRQICRRFRDRIMSSPILRRKLFLTSARGPVDPLEPEPVRSRAHPRMFYRKPLLPHASVPSRSSDQRTQYRCGLEVNQLLIWQSRYRALAHSASIAVPDQANNDGVHPEEADLQRVGAWLNGHAGLGGLQGNPRWQWTHIRLDRLEADPEGLWRNMYLTNPPITRATIQAPFLGPFHERLPPLVIRSQSGLTMGDVVTKLRARCSRMRCLRKGLEYPDGSLMSPRVEDVLGYKWSILEWVETVEQ